MPRACRLVLQMMFALALAFSPGARGQDALIPSPNPLVPSQPGNHLTLEYETALWRRVRASNSLAWPSGKSEK